MKVYENLAPYYDRFMDHINYETEAEAVYRFLFQIDRTHGRTLDVGAGSGGHMIPLLKMGIKTDGMDYSERMCRILAEKLHRQHLPGHVLTGDMRCFTTEYPYDVIYCLGETIHHLESLEDASAFFRCGYEALKPGGYLIFSWQERGYFDELADYGDFYDRHGDDYLLWNTCLADDLDEDEPGEDAEDAAYLSYTAFIHEENETYRRICETHRLAIYYGDELEDTVGDAGFLLRNDMEELCFGKLLTELPFKHITVLEKK